MLANFLHGLAETVLRECGRCADTDIVQLIVMLRFVDEVFWSGACWVMAQCLAGLLAWFRLAMRARGIWKDKVQ